MLHLDPSSPLDLILHSAAFWLTGAGAAVWATVRSLRGGDNAGR